MKLKCCIVKDLLPNYIDGLTSQEANEEIKKHLESCLDCRRACEQMSAEFPKEAAWSDDNIDFLKKMRGRLRKRYAAVMLLTCTVLIGFTVFAKNYNIPVPYNPNYMTVETYEAAPIVSEFGITQWTDLNALDFDTSKAVMAGEYDTLSLIRLVITEPALWDNVQSKGRTIYRDGEKVRVVYYCYTRTLWNRLFPSYYTRLNKTVSTGDIYDMRLHRAEYKPIMTELYYLPMNSARRLEQLSDEEFYSLKKNAIPVWKGMN